MAKIIVQVEIEKELNDVANLVCKLVTEIVEKRPLPEIISTTIGDLQIAILGFDEISGEFSDDPAAAQKAFMIPIADMIAAIIRSSDKKKVF